MDLLDDNVFLCIVKENCAIGLCQSILRQIKNTQGQTLAAQDRLDLNASYSILAAVERAYFCSIAFDSFEQPYKVIVADTVSANV